MRRARAQQERALRGALLGAAALASLGARAAFAQQRPRVAVEEDADMEVSATPRSRATPSVAPSAEAPAVTAPVREDAITALRAELEQLRGRVRALEAQPAPAQPAAVAAPSAPAPAPDSLLRVGLRPDAGSVLDPVGLSLTGYLQVQHEWSQLSEDQLQQGGAPLNRDRFLLRRGRLRIDGSWRWFAASFELDASTTRGPFVGVRRAEASFLYRSRTAGAPPYVMVTAGLTENPFGFELVEGNRRRIFMERSVASLAFFRGEPDLGVRVAGGFSFFRYAVALMNGSPLDDRAGAIPSDPTGAKDVMGRVGVDTGVANTRWQITGGVSFLAGTGFHAGTDATRNRVVWRDTNENGAVDNGELSAVPGQAATPSVNFARWAVNADLGLRVRSALGWTHVYGEVTMASNLDRSLFVADPIAAGGDVRHLAGYVGITQEVLRYGVVGLRYDYYNPNADLLDSRRGRLVPVDGSLHTVSPLVGAVWPGYGRLVVQYDLTFDSLARDGAGVPTDLRNDQVTARLQGEF